MGRMDKVNEQVKREISQILQRQMEDPLFLSITVLSVKVSPDLRHARIRFSVLGEESLIKKALERLNRSRGYLRHQLGKRLVMRFTPELEFVYDKSVLYSSQIEKTLTELKSQQRSVEDAGSDQEADGVNEGSP